MGQIFALGRGSTNCETTDQQRGLPHPNRDPLALFAAIAHAVVKPHIIADGPYLTQSRSTVSD